MRTSDHRPDRRPAAPARALALVLAVALTGCADDGEPAGESSSSTSAGDVATGPRHSSTAASTTVGAPAAGSPEPSTTSGSAVRPDPRSLPTPYIASVTWGESAYGPTLKIAPTPNGRATAGVTDGNAAWREVLALRPDADTPGMYGQFLCHWDFARLLEPDKPTWNIEPWRPEVDAVVLMASGCNPGGPEV